MQERALLGMRLRAGLRLQQHLFELLDRLGALLLFFRPAPLFINVDRLRVEGDHLFVVGQGLVQIVLCRVGQGPVEVRLGISRIELDRLIVVFDRMIECALTDIGGRAESGNRGGKGRMDRFPGCR